MYIILFYGMQYVMWIVVFLSLMIIKKKKKEREREREKSIKNYLKYRYS